MDNQKKFNRIYRFTQLRGRSPSYDEVCKIFSFRSKSSAHYLIKKLVKDGFLRVADNGTIQMLRWAETPIPFMGSIHAGKTVGFAGSAEAEVGEVMTLNELLTADLETARLFKVQGDSMIDAGIFENDILLVECTDKWKPGDIVIAKIDGEETVKYIYNDKNHKPFLKPANSQMEDMIPEESLQVIAVVKNVIKSYG
jgi:repressor LexA